MKPEGAGGSMVGQWGPPAPTVTHQTQMGYSEQVKQDARKAAEYIRERGWCRYEFIAPDGRCCMVAAIDKATGKWWGSGLYQAAIDETGTKTGGLGSGYNDRPGRTKEEVLAVFDRIANG